MDDEGIRVVDEAGAEEDGVIPFQYSITSYGADYPVDGLVKRIRAGDIYIPPFQRGYVWNLVQASRFVESLLLGLPVPGIFLSKEEETQKLVVIDGQQRLRTLQYFYDGIFGKSRREFALKSVQPQFERATYKTLLDEDRRRLDDSVIHATIVKQDVPSDDDSSIYHIFERLNTGGTLLQAQEIRACMYHGEFNDLLNELNTNEAWRNLYGPLSKRMKDQELILRFFAIYFDAKGYKKPMIDFLNKHMASNRHLQHYSREDLSKLFTTTVELICDSLAEKAFKPRRSLNAAVFDAVMVGVARRLAKAPIADQRTLKKRYDELLEKPDFIKAYESATTDEESVRRRLQLATAAFANVK